MAFVMPPSLSLRPVPSLRTGRLLLLFVLVWLAPAQRPARAADAVRVAVATSLHFLEGRASWKAVRLAVSEINEAGGVAVGDRRLPIHLTAVDLRDADPSVPVASSVGRLEKLLAEGGHHAVLVGPFRSEVLLASMDLFAHHRVPLLATIAMSPAADAMVLRNPKYRFVFRVSLNTQYLVGYLIDTMKFLQNRFGFDRVYIVNQDVAWARSTASLMIKLFFNRAGWRLVGQRDYSSNARDFSEALEEALGGGAQVILPIFDSATGGLLVEQWHERKVPALLCGFVSPLVSPSAWEAFDGRIAGTLNAVFELGNVPSSRHRPAGAFYRAYRERYGHPVEAGHGPAPSYDAVYVLADAVTRAGSLEPDRLVAALKETDRTGAIGRIRFHPGNQVVYGTDPDREALACMIQWTPDGRRRIVHPPAVAEGEIAFPPFLEALQR